MSRKIVIEINFPVLLAMFALLFVAGWVNGYRERGNLQVLEAKTRALFNC